MPKMKDKKSENKEDEDKKTSQKDSSVTDADSEKAFYLTQIRYLDEQLERWGKKKKTTTKKTLHSCLGYFNLCDSFSIRARTRLTEISSNFLCLAFKLNSNL